MRTWHLETSVVALVLVAINLAAHSPPLEWLGAAAVLLSFGHASVADRMAERQGRMARPDVECWRASAGYFVGKELCWAVYFVAHQSWSALAGCLLFILHPIWRRFYRTRRPILA